MELAILDFQQLRIKHIAYKSKVRSVLYGGSYENGYFQNSNPVALWFIETGNLKYRHEPRFEKLKKLHQQFSKLSEELVAIYQNDLIEQAHNGLVDLNALSDLFLQELAAAEQVYIR